MEKELYIQMGFYLTINKNESEEEAKDRFYNIINSLEKSSIAHESSYQIYETTVQECI